MRKKLLALKANGIITSQHPWNANTSQDLLEALTSHINKQTDNSSWLDHHGATKVGDHEIFANEPYWFHPEPNRLFADLLGCEWCVFANSWWYPGMTIRIAFWPKEAKDFKAGLLTPPV